MPKYSIGTIYYAIYIIDTYTLNVCIYNQLINICFKICLVFYKIFNISNSEHLFPLTRVITRKEETFQDSRHATYTVIICCIIIVKVIIHTFSMIESSKHGVTFHYRLLLQVKEWSIHNSPVKIHPYNRTIYVMGHASALAIHIYPCLILLRTKAESISTESMRHSQDVSVDEMPREGHSEHCTGHKSSHKQEPYFLCGTHVTNSILRAAPH